VAAVDAHVHAQQWSAREVAAQLRAQAAQAFAHALYAQGALELAQHNVALSQRVLQATQDRVAAGAARAVEGELAQLGVDQALQAQAAAAARHQAALVTLLGVMGGWNQDVTRVEGALHSARPVPALDEVLAAARQRPDVEAARAGHGAALQDARLAATEAIPSPTLGAQYQYWNREHAMVGTVTFPLPVFSRGQGEEARARTRAFGYQREADARVQQAQAQARAAHALLTSLAAQRERLQLGPSQALLTRLEDAWRAREVTLDVVLDAQRRVMAARLDALELDLQEALAFVVLDLTMGVQP
jgi:cobalt-zinc-cadmium efflux system outer membrane protein